MCGIQQTLTFEEMEAELRPNTVMPKISFDNKGIDIPDKQDRLSTPKPVATAQFGVMTKLTVMDRKLYNILIRWALPDIRETHRFRIPVSLVAKWLGKEKYKKDILSRTDPLQTTLVKFDVLGNDAVCELLNRYGFREARETLLGTCYLTQDGQYIEYTFGDFSRLLISYPQRYVSVGLKTMDAFSSVHHLALYESLLVDFNPSLKTSKSRWYNFDELADVMCIPIADRDEKLIDRGLAYLKSKLLKKSVEAINANPRAEFRIAVDRDSGEIRYGEDRLGRKLNRILFYLEPKSTGFVEQVYNAESAPPSKRRALLESVMEYCGLTPGDMEMMIGGDIERLYSVCNRIDFHRKKEGSFSVDKSSFENYLAHPESIPSGKEYMEHKRHRNDVARERISQILEEKIAGQKNKGGYKSVNYVAESLLKDCGDPVRAKELQLVFVNGEEGCVQYGEEVQAYIGEIYSRFTPELTKLYYFWIYENDQFCLDFLQTADEKQVA